MSEGPFLYPSVTRLPSTPGLGPSEKPDRIKPEGLKGEFDHVLEKVSEPLKFSAHAAQRLRDRKISFDPAMMSRVSDAIDRAAAKGIEDTLVLTPEAALIVSVKNKTVITALDRSAASGNVFTNIDGAVIV